jgi:proteasome lid subunit RPN8/RPN11
MQANTVRIKKSQAAYFRAVALREAKKSGKEIQAYLVGRIVSPTLTVVDEFKYTTKYAVQTTQAVQWYEDDYNVVKQYAEKNGKHVIGDAHSHPNWDAVLSPTDYCAHIQEGFRIAGICSIQNGRTRLRFWIAESALPLKIEYV